MCSTAKHCSSSVLCASFPPINCAGAAMRPAHPWMTNEQRGTPAIEIIGAQEYACVSVRVRALLTRSTLTFFEEGRPINHNTKD